MTTEKVPLPERLDYDENAKHLVDDIGAGFIVNGHADLLIELAHRYNSQPALIAAAEIALKEITNLTCGGKAHPDVEQQMRAALQQAGKEI